MFEISNFILRLGALKWKSSAGVFPGCTVRRTNGSIELRSNLRSCLIEKVARYNFLVFCKERWL